MKMCHLLFFIKKKLAVWKDTAHISSFDCLELCSTVVYECDCRVR